jgi:lysyl-tRNA synthetase class 2
MAEEQTETDLKRIKREKLDKLVSMGVEPYKYRFQVKDSIADVKKRFKDVTHEKTAEKVTVGGRIMQTRLHGKAGFADILGQEEKIQLYFRKDDIGERRFELFI